MGVSGLLCNPPACALASRSAPCARWTSRRSETVLPRSANPTASPTSYRPESTIIEHHEVDELLNVVGLIYSTGPDRARTVEALADAARSRDC
jgi:hypothetical protein